MEVHLCIQSIFSCNFPRFSISNHVRARIDRTLALSSLLHDVPSIKPDFLTEHVKGASWERNNSYKRPVSTNSSMIQDVEKNIECAQKSQFTQAPRPATVPHITRRNAEN
jgi:hypothetical protein